MAALIQRHLEGVVRELLAHFPGVVIEGSRQVGKSTLASLVVGDDAVIANLDHESVRDAAAADPAGFVAQAGDGTLVIDEVQRLPEITLAVKAAIDADRRPGRFVLTGSSSLLRVRGTADSLAGRAARVEMFGFSQGEAAQVRDDFAARAIADPASAAQARSSMVRVAYAEMLGRGSYPEVREMPDRIRARWIDSYVQSIVGRDLAELRRSVEPARAEAILRAMAGRQSAELVKAKLAEETSVPPRTITGYLDLLHDVGLIASIPPWTPNIAKREVGRPKTFVVDSAVAMRLARVTPGQLSSLAYGEVFGAALEAFVAAELLRQRGWSDQSFDVFHYRERNGDEVDIVLEFEDGRVIAIEVKASSSYSAKQFRTLARLRDRLGDRFVAGFVLGTASKGYRYADRLYGAPVSVLWEAAGA